MRFRVGAVGKLDLAGDDLAEGTVVASGTVATGLPFEAISVVVEVAAEDLVFMAETQRNTLRRKLKYALFLVVVFSLDRRPAQSIHF
jgi:hypothetical protein